MLAQLLFGRNLSSITPLQAIQLASAVATLAGRGGGGIVEGFRDRLGVDSFDITTDNQGNAAVQAGIYLTDQIYTEAIVSNEETEINLNFDVSRDVTVRGSITSEGDTALGIYSNAITDPQSRRGPPQRAAAAPKYRSPVRKPAVLPASAHSRSSAVSPRPARHPAAGPRARIMSRTRSRMAGHVSTDGGATTAPSTGQSRAATTGDSGGCNTAPGPHP